MYIYTHTYIHTYIHTQTCIHTYTHTHTQQYRRKHVTITILATHRNLVHTDMLHQRMTVFTHTATARMHSNPPTHCSILPQTSSHILYYTCAHTRPQMHICLCTHPNRRIRTHKALGHARSHIGTYVCAHTRTQVYKCSNTHMHRRVRTHKATMSAHTYAKNVCTRTKHWKNVRTSACTYVHMHTHSKSEGHT